MKTERKNFVRYVGKEAEVMNAGSKKCRLGQDSDMDTAKPVRNERGS
jgi:hypothetical protein